MLLKIAQSLFDASMADVQINFEARGNSSCRTVLDRHVSPPGNPPGSRILVVTWLLRPPLMSFWFALQRSSLVQCATGQGIEWVAAHTAKARVTMLHARTSILLARDYGKRPHPPCLASQQNYRGGSMLHAFLTTDRSELTNRCRQKVSRRSLKGSRLDQYRGRMRWITPRKGSATILGIPAESGRSHRQWSRAVDHLRKRRVQ